MLRLIRSLVSEGRESDIKLSCRHLILSAVFNQFFPLLLRGSSLFFAIFIESRQQQEQRQQGREGD